MAATSSAAAQRRPQLTTRAILTGLLLGTILTPCNVYAGLKIGWAFNMSIAAALLSYGAWALAARWGTARPWGLLENNINQTTASAAASIVSAGLVAPIPALTLLTGQELTWPWLAFWVLAVSLLGVALGVGLRRHMLEVEALTFPAGVATAETVREIYARGQEAAPRIRMLLGGGLAAASLKLASDHLSAVSRIAPPISWPIGGASAQNLGFALDPSLLMVGFGAIVGLRVGLSLLIGAVLAWGVLGPWALGQGWAQTGEASPEAVWFSSMVKWLLWPGVTLMLTSSPP